ncbi:MAG: HD domain-containing protein, partial [Planctomycetota bacterium]
MITLEQVRNHPQARIFMEMADTNLAAMGYTEHGVRHAKLVAAMTQYVLKKLGYDEKTQVLGSIAGFLHDIGNAINRNDHGISSAFLSYQILKDLKADYQDIARIISAAGNHDEERGEPVNDIAAAVVIADKADVHSSRVRSTKELTFDIHDRVNYAVKRSRLQVNPTI